MLTLTRGVALARVGSVGMATPQRGPGSLTSPANAAYFDHYGSSPGSDSAARGCACGGLRWPALPCCPRVRWIRTCKVTGTARPSSDPRVRWSAVGSSTDVARHGGASSAEAEHPSHWVAPASLAISGRAPGRRVAEQAEGEERGRGAGRSDRVDSGGDEPAHGAGAGALSAFQCCFQCCSARRAVGGAETGVRARP